MEYQNKSIQAQIKSYLFSKIYATGASIVRHIGRDPRTVYAAINGMDSLLTTDKGYCLNGETRQAMVAENKSA